MSSEVALALILTFGPAPAAPPEVSRPPCPNCTTCGANCPCFGGGYYCADGKCPIQPVAKAAPVAAAGHYENLQICDGRTCRMVRTWVSDSSATTFGSIPVGGFTYDPVGSQVQPTFGSDPGGTVGAGAGFHPVRNFFQRIRSRRGGGGCASCG